MLTAGFPCQDISGAGRRAGIKPGTRSGLFFEVVRALRDLRPGFVVIENVAALRWHGGGMDIVLAELHHAGYDCLWTSLRAADVGAPHRRERVFLLGWPRHVPVRNAALAADDRRGLELVPDMPAAANTDVAWGPYEAAIRRWEAVLERPAPCPVEPGRSRPRLAPRFVDWLMGLNDGYVTDPGLALPRTAQLRILGNGVVPRQATYALRALLPRQAALADELPRAA